MTVEAKYIADVSRYIGNEPVVAITTGEGETVYLHVDGHKVEVLTLEQARALIAEEVRYNAAMVSAPRIHAGTRRGHERHAEHFREVLAKLPKEEVAEMAQTIKSMKHGDRITNAQLAKHADFGWTNDGVLVYINGHIADKFDQGGLEQLIQSMWLEDPEHRTLIADKADAELYADGEADCFNDSCGPDMEASE